MVSKHVLIALFLNLPTATLKFKRMVVVLENADVVFKKHDIQRTIDIIIKVYSIIEKLLNTQNDYKYL